MRKNSKNIDIDFDKLVDVFNRNGRVAAEEYVKNSYDIEYYLAIRKLTHETGYRYNKSSRKYELKESTENQFLSIEELCNDAKTKPVKTLENLNTECNISLETIFVDLMRDRLVEISKYISIEQSSRKIIINLQSLKKSGYEVTMV